MCLLPRLIPPSDKAAAEDERELDRVADGPPVSDSLLEPPLIADSEPPAVGAEADRMTAWVMPLDDRMGDRM